MDYPKRVILANISQYAEKWGVTRDVVYERLKSGDITAYEIQEDLGKTYLNLDEDPQVRPYTREEAK